jgi:hypothetical protein
MPPASASEPPGGPPRLICRCLGVSSVRIWEAIQAQGPRVELHVSPVDDPALRELISERLRKLVCADLEIAFCE